MDLSHSWQGAQKITSRYLSVAEEYFSARNQEDWDFLPYALMVHCPDEERFLNNPGTPRQDIVRRQWDLNNQMKKRIEEVRAFLRERPDVIKQDAITLPHRFSFAEMFGILAHKDHIAELRLHSALRHCRFQLLDDETFRRLITKSAYAPI